MTHVRIPDFSKPVPVRDLAERRAARAAALGLHPQALELVQEPARPATPVRALGTSRAADRHRHHRRRDPPDRVRLAALTLPRPPAADDRDQIEASISHRSRDRAEAEEAPASFPTDKPPQPFEAASSSCVATSGPAGS